KSILHLDMVLSIEFQRHYRLFTPERLRAWTPSVILFGTAAGSAVALIAERIPRVRNEILQNVPIIGNYWAPKEE
ncbi:4310_t:CDS:2, partial [Acaulospora morrowiae]